LSAILPFLPIRFSRLSKSTHRRHRPCQLSASAKPTGIF
jgi:hypothetical protein